MFGRSRRQPVVSTSGTSRGNRRGIFGGGGRTTRREKVMPKSSSSNRRGFGGSSRNGGGLFHRTDPNRRAGGLKAALHNPNTTHQGRRNAKMELRAMGRGDEAYGHPSLTSRLKRMFGIRSRQSAPRAQAHPYPEYYDGV